MNNNGSTEEKWEMNVINNRDGGALISAGDQTADVVGQHKNKVW